MKSSTILNSFSPAALVKAIEGNYIEAWTNFGLIDGELYRDDEIIRIASAIPYIPYNGVFYTRWPDDIDLDTKIQECIHYFKARNAQMVWAINPSTRPTDLAKYLLRHDFTLVQELVGMAVDLDGLPDQVVLPPQTEIHEVDDAHSLRQFVDLVAWKWHLPPDANDLFFRMNLQIGMGGDKPGRRFLAYQNGVPVAKAFLYKAAGVVGIYGVSMIPEARRQGLGTAITHKVFLTARQSGYRIGILQSTEMGLPIYQRLGFQEYCRFYMYALL